VDGGFKPVEQLDEQWTGARGTDARCAPSCDFPAPPATKLAYPPTAALPTQQGPAGIYLDQGARVTLPKRAQGQWRVRLSDLDTGNILFDSENQGAFVTSAKHCSVRIGIDVWDVDDAGHAALLMSHAYEQAPALALPDESRLIAGPYVCIAVQASSGCWTWNNPNGWREVVAALKLAGYRVICIDQKPVHGQRLTWTHIPHGAEDQAGDRPLTERARWLRHAAFFVGLSSGLSWLARAAGCPVVMISGFTHPTNAFATPFRVVNRHACNGCWNDLRLRFDHKDFLWCPRHAGTARQFECTRLITAQQDCWRSGASPASASTSHPFDLRNNRRQS
jgi:hypothetical protein